MLRAGEEISIVHLSPAELADAVRGRLPPVVHEPDDVADVMALADPPGVVRDVVRSERRPVHRHALDGSRAITCRQAKIPVDAAPSI